MPNIPRYLLTTLVAQQIPLRDIYIHRVSQEECARLRESVPYVKLY